MTICIPDDVHSFTLQRLSPATYPADVINLQLRRGVTLSRKELGTIKSLMADGVAYRCRIAKGRYYYGDTAQTAVDLAVVNRER